MNVVVVNAFTKTPSGGNPAGVVIDARSLSDEQMQQIAFDLGLSETAFVLPSDLADFKVRFFTPVSEVDLCGHATIATFYLLSHQGIISTGAYMQETRAGILGVEVLGDGTVFMQQNNPQFFEFVDRKAVADTLNIPVSSLHPDLPPQIVSTGLRDVIVPVKNLATLSQTIPNFPRVAEFSKELDVVGYHLFCLETVTGATAHCRNLAPLFDIPEESATGTSNGALACYLLQRGVLTSESVHNKTLLFEQGYSMRCPSEILVKLTVNSDGGKIDAVKVGGSACLANYDPHFASCYQFDTDDL